MADQKQLALRLNGNAHIDIFIGDDEYASNRVITRHCLIASWATLLNCARKGDAAKIESLYRRIFDEDEWNEAVDKALAIGGLHNRLAQLAKDGFKRIDVGAIIGEIEDMEDRELAKYMLVGVMASLINLKRMGEADEVAKIGVTVAGQEEWEDTLQEMLGN